jgi:hypothetical protein
MFQTVIEVGKKRLSRFFKCQDRIYSSFLEKTRDKEVLKILSTDNMEDIPDTGT